MWRISAYLAENFMGLRFVEFKPQGRMVVFTGKNGQGKTSALAGLPYVLAGKKWSPEMPTRRGATHHKVELVLENGEKGAFTIRRTQSGLKLEMANGCKAWGTPQAMLDSIYQELTLDPIEFIRIGKDKEGKRQQVEILKGAITLDVDLNDLAQQNAVDFQKRREVNREVERLKGEIAAIPVQPNLPDAPVDIAAIQEQIREANEHNRNVIGKIEERQRISESLAAAELGEKRNKELIEVSHERIEKLTADLDRIAPAGRMAAAIRDGLEELRDKAQQLPEISGVAARVRDAISEARVRALAYIPQVGQAQSDINAELDGIRKTVKAAELQQNRLSQAVAEAREAWEQAPKPAMIDTASLSEELTHAQMVNREIEKRDRQKELIKQRDEKEAESRALTRAMDAREEEKRAAVANAKMPIDGLTFTTEEGKEEILFEGVPISQLGEAQQLRISISIALARKPQLRIIRIPHGEALDDESMAALAEMAEQMDFYVWMAKVDTSGKLGIFLEDGEVKTINETPPKKEDLA